MEVPTQSTYLIKGILDKRTLTVMYGASNTGKTFVAMDMAAHIAAGKAWGGRKVREGLVVYIAAEAGRGAIKRVKALESRIGTSSFALALVPMSIDLRGSTRDMKLIIKAVRAAESARGLKCELLVVDTLSRAMAGGDENSSVDMGALVANVDTLRAELDTALMVVHHTGKDAAKGARGHSLLKAATDAEIEIAANNDSGERSIKTTKQRDMEYAPPIRFALNTVTLNHDEDGDPITTCTVLLEGEPGFDFFAADEMEKLEKQRRDDDSLAVAVAIGMEIDRCSVASVLTKAMEHTGHGESKTRDLINAAIPENAEGRAVVTHKGTFSIRRERQGKGSKAHVHLVRARMVIADEAA